MVKTRLQAVKVQSYKLFHNNQYIIITFPPTINHDCRRHAPPLGNNVGSHAGVVPGVGQTRLSDDQVVICSGVNVLIQVGIYGLLILQPFHLEREGGRKQGEV